MEVSSHALELGRVAGIRFACRVFTNLTQDHLDFHETMEAYFAAKRRLFEEPGLAVVNVDDGYGRRIAAEVDAVTFGVEYRDLDPESLRRADAPVTRQARQVWDKLAAEARGALDELQAVLDNEVAKLSKSIVKAGVPGSGGGTGDAAGCGPGVGLRGERSEHTLRAAITARS